MTWNFKILKIHQIQKTTKMTEAQRSKFFFLDFFFFYGFDETGLKDGFCFCWKKKKMKKKNDRMKMTSSWSVVDSDSLNCNRFCYDTLTLSPRTCFIYTKGKVWGHQTSALCLAIFCHHVKMRKKKKIKTKNLKTLPTLTYATLGSWDLTLVRCK